MVVRGALDNKLFRLHNAQPLQQVRFEFKRKKEGRREAASSLYSLVPWS
jgi:hypothetical protein